MPRENRKLPLFSPPEKMISSEALEGVPLLVLANKQDVPVLWSLFFIAAKFIMMSLKILMVILSVIPHENAFESSENSKHSVRPDSLQPRFGASLLVN